MEIERLSAIAERLREMANFGRNEYVYLDVTVRQDKYFDLGEFGESQTEVEIEDDSYEQDARELLDKFPITTSGFEELADELDEIASEGAPLDLDGMLNKMEFEGEMQDRGLARAIRGFIDSFKAALTTMAPINLNGLSVGPLPAKPLPWPGALRQEIDYTADDFPLRYQPPPGFDWSVGGYESVGYMEARKAEATGITEGAMILDKFGRVSYRVRNDDDLSEGSRWYVWHLNRDGIPEGMGFGGDTPPRALDAMGKIITEPSTLGTQFAQVDYNWGSGASAVKAETRLRELRDEYERSIMPVNEYGVSYDPKTVAVSDDSSYTDTVDLVPGDQINSYGRVLTVQPSSGDEYLVRFWSSADRIVEDSRRNFNWLGYKMTLDREKQPTALSIWQAKQGVPLGSIAYDPRTVEIATDNSRSMSSELRRGDFVLAYGRVLDVRRDGSRFVVTTDGSDGNAMYRGEDYNWAIKAITGVDRAAQPTALSLSEGAPQAIGYDPLTVALDPVSRDVQTSELRLGDNITGTEFGRVVSVTLNESGDYKITMNRDGKINTYEESPDDQGWDVEVISGVDRAAQPTAISLGTTATVGSIGYDPLAVQLKEEKGLTLNEEIRLGDDILGSSFGRVVGVMNGTFVLDRDGTRRDLPSSPGDKWQTREIDVPDRNAIPTALSLGTYAAPPVPEPAF